MAQLTQNPGHKQRTKVDPNSEENYQPRDPELDLSNLPPLSQLKQPTVPKELAGLKELILTAFAKVYGS